MKNIFTASIAVFVGLVAAAAGFRELTSLGKFWWSVRHSLGIFQGDLLFVSWIVIQTIVYLALAAGGILLILMRPWARIPVLVLLVTDALFKLIAPPVTRTDIVLAAVSLLAAAILLFVPGLKVVSGLE